MLMNSLVLLKNMPTKCSIYDPVGLDTVIKISCQTSISDLLFFYLLQTYFQFCFIENKKIGSLLGSD